MEVIKKYVFLSVNVLIYVMLYGTTECNCAPKAPIIPRLAVVTVSNNPDSLPKNTSETTKQIYHGVSSLLAYKMVSWLNCKELSQLQSDYLGLPSETVNLINVAMSLLICEQRDQHIISIDNLVDAYFYSCDPKSMLDLTLPLETVLDNVDNNFKQLVENLKINRYEIGGREEDKLVNELQSALKNSITQDQVEIVFIHSVTISSMKNMMFENLKPSEESANIFMQLAQDHNKTVQQLQETNGKKVIANHVTLIASLVPYIFEYAYNHIKLVVEFRRRNFHLPYVNEADTSTKKIQENDKLKDIRRIDRVCKDDKATLDRIVGLSGFIDNLKEILLDRYFYFINIPFNSLFQNAVNKLAEYMRPDKYLPYSPIIKFYLSNPKDTSQLYNEMWELFDNVLSNLLALSGRKVNVEKWKKMEITTRINKNYTNLDKSKLLELMTKNTDNAFAATRAFGKSLVSTKTIEHVIKIPPKKKSDDHMQTISPKDLSKLSTKERRELYRKKKMNSKNR